MRACDDPETPDGLRASAARLRLECRVLSERAGQNPELIVRNAYAELARRWSLVAAALEVRAMELSCEAEQPPKHREEGGDGEHPHWSLEVSPDRASGLPSQAMLL